MLKITGLEKQEAIDRFTPDPKTGIYRKAQGGTEMMYKGLTDRLTSESLKGIQLICSRVKELEEDKKRVLWLHDTWDDPESKHLADPKSRERFDKLVFVSQYQFNSYHMGLGVPYKGSNVIRNAIVPIEKHSKPNVELGGIQLIYHTTPHRGLEILVPVFLELIKRHPLLQLDIYSSFSIYGWGERDEPYKQLFDFCKQHPNIRYHGAVPNSVVREALKQAHIFAYPSIWPETSCIAAIEAMSAGCAVVAPDYAALPETLGSYGFMYRWSEDVNEHANRFGSMLNAVIKNYEGPLVQKNIVSQKEYADIFFSWDTRIKDWNNLLGELSK